MINILPPKLRFFLETTKKIKRNLCKSVKSVGLINSKEENLRHLRNLRDQTPAQIGLQEKKIPKDYLLCLSLQKKCHVLKIGSQRASAGKYLTKCIFLHIFRKYFFAMPCCVKCPYLVKCCPKLPPFSISANNNFPRFSSIGAIIFSSDSPNASCSTYITAPANFHNPRCFNSQVYLGGPIPYKLGEGFDAPPTLERSGSEQR